MNIVFKVIDSAELAKIFKEYPVARLSKIFDLLFISVFHRLGLGLLNQDKIFFALRLVQIRLDKECAAEFEMLLRKSASIKEPALSGSLLEGRLSKSQLLQLEEINATDMFKGIVDHIMANQSDWLDFIKTNNAEAKIPSFVADSSSISGVIKNLIILKIFRADRLSIACQKLIALVLKEEFLNIPEIDLQRAVE